MGAAAELKEADEEGGLELLVDGGMSCQSPGTTGGSPSTEECGMGISGDALRKPGMSGYMPLCCYPKTKSARRR
jgi:hypothetical protein